MRRLIPSVVLARAKAFRSRLLMLMMRVRAGDDGALEELASLLPVRNGVRRRRITSWMRWRYQASKARKLVPEVLPKVRTAKFAFRKLHDENGGVWKADMDAYAEANPEVLLAFVKLHVDWKPSEIYRLLKLQPLQFVYDAIGKMAGRKEHTGKKLARGWKKQHAAKVPKK